LKNPGWQRGEEFFHKARRNKGEGRDLRLRRNEAFGKKARRPKGILPPCHGAASLPILPILWIRCRVRFFNRLIGLRDAADAPIWQHAIKNEAILVTKDEDFGHRFRQGGSAPVILWLRIGNTSRQALLQYFIPLLPRIDEMVRQGERLIEVR
jgi:predicted nuclease of predicted toxin-antitoxin system